MKRIPQMIEMPPAIAKAAMQATKLMPKIATMDSQEFAALIERKLLDIRDGNPHAMLDIGIHMIALASVLFEATGEEVTLTHSDLPYRGDPSKH